jgi:hypothetical protein
MNQIARLINKIPIKGNGYDLRLSVLPYKNCICFETYYKGKNVHYADKRYDDLKFTKTEKIKIKILYFFYKYFCVKPFMLKINIKRFYQKITYRGDLPF